MNNLTIVYYTSNKEDENLEKRIRDNILGASGGKLPIVSVSQKPINFGQNICVGEVGASNHNLFRQIQIACQMAKTDFVISCEADCLYAPDYFDFKPTDLNECYRFTPLYILNQWGKGEYSGFYLKDVAPFAQVCGREHYIKEVDRVLEGRSYWGEPGEKNPPDLFRRHRWKVVEAKSPIVSLKTLQGLRKHTKIFGLPVDEIPYWGKAVALRKELWG